MGQLWEIESTAMVIWSYDTSSIEESYNDEATETPARETDNETPHIHLQLPTSWHECVWQISHWIDAWLTLELFTKIFSIILNNVVIPKNVQPSAMPSPTN